MFKDKLRYSVNPGSILVKTAMVLLGLSVLLRIIGYWGFWTEGDQPFLTTQIILPVCSFVIYAAIVTLFGEKNFSLTVIPVLLGVLFFITDAVSGEGIFSMLLYIAFDLVVAVVYAGTVFGKIESKWFLLPCFALPFFYHVFFKYRALLFGTQTAKLDVLLPELSVLLMLIAMSLMSIAMRKRPPEAKETLEGEIAEPYVIQVEPVVPAQAALPEKGEEYEQED